MVITLFSAGSNSILNAIIIYALNSESTHSLNYEISSKRTHTNINKVTAVLKIDHFGKFT